MALTRDGVVVIYHDQRVNPDVTRGPDGTRIPRLSDLFDLVKKSGNTRVGFDCETSISPLEPEAEGEPSGSR